MEIRQISFKLCILMTVLATQVCSAATYEYTDSKGVTHLTDDPQKIPAELRAAQKVGESYPTPEPSNTGTQQETGWISSSEYQRTFNRMVDNRYYSTYAEGRLFNGYIQYRGTFKPFFKGLKRFYSYYGMSDEVFSRRKATFEAAGFKELYHTHFREHSGERLHQACWLEVSTR